MGPSATWRLFHLANNLYLSPGFANNNNNNNNNNKGFPSESALGGSSRSSRVLKIHINKI
jgi:hypothetical protein